MSTLAYELNSHTYTTQTDISSSLRLACFPSSYSWANCHYTEMPLHRCSPQLETSFSSWKNPRHALPPPTHIYTSHHTPQVIWKTPCQYRLIFLALQQVESEHTLHVGTSISSIWHTLISSICMGSSSVALQSDTSHLLNYSPHTRLRSWSQRSPEIHASHGHHVHETVPLQSPGPAELYLTKLRMWHQQIGCTPALFFSTVTMLETGNPCTHQQRPRRTQYLAAGRQRRSTHPKAR